MEVSYIHKSGKIDLFDAITYPIGILHAVGVFDIFLPRLLY